MCDFFKGWAFSVVIKEEQVLQERLVDIAYDLVIDSLSAIMYDLSLWAYALNSILFKLAHAVSTVILSPTCPSRVPIGPEKGINHEGIVQSPPGSGREQAMDVQSQ
jgi:hypothetical protein